MYLCIEKRYYLSKEVSDSNFCGTDRVLGEILIS